MTEIAAECIELCFGDCLLGYAIKFCGDWDAYLYRHRSLECIARNETKERALEMIRASAPESWRDREAAP